MNELLGVAAAVSDARTQLFMKCSTHLLTAAGCCLLMVLC
jgi:hypothetical protein